MRKGLAVMLLSSVVALGSAAQPPTTSFQGSWALDIGRSTSPPGEPLPKSSIMRITVDDGKSFAWTQTTVGPDGKTSGVSYRGAFDGRSYPLSGGAGTLAFTRLSATSFHDEGSDPTGAHWSETCTLGSDQRTMTCTGEQSAPQGGSTNYTDTWVRS